MAKGNEIIVSAQPRGHFTEGVIATSNTPYPGTIMQIDATVATVGGRHTYKIYDRDADGDRPVGAFYVLLPDHLRGKTATDAYAAGDRCFLYAPVSGDELNLLIADVVSGTGTGAAADHAAGEILMVDDGTGKMIATTGSPETEVAVLMETLNDLTSDTLGWCLWSGR